MPGVDIGACWGSPIVAAGDGRVVAAGWAGGYGREVQIAHGDGLLSLYGHMSEIVAAPGSFVRQGQLIGYVGSSGLSTGPHVHFEVRRSGQPVNPLGSPLLERAGGRRASGGCGQGAAEGVAERRSSNELGSVRRQFARGGRSITLPPRKRTPAWPSFTQRTWTLRCCIRGITSVSGSPRSNRSSVMMWQPS